MKRHFLKDIVLVLLPTAIFLLYASIWQPLRYSVAAKYNYLPLTMFNLFAPILVGAILCAALYYAWSNRASTVFISLFCGAFMMNLIFGLCSANVIHSLGALRLGSTILFGGTGGIEMTGVIDGTYIVMFWVSLVSFIKSKKNKQLKNH